MIRIFFFSVSMVLSLSLLTSCENGKKDPIDTGNTGDTENTEDVEDTDTCEHGDVRNCVDFESFERCVNGSWTTIFLKHKGLEWSCVRSDCKESSGERLPNIQELRMLIQNCPLTEYPKPSGQDTWCELEDPDHLDSGVVCDGCPVDHDGKYSVFGDTDVLRSSSKDVEYGVLVCVHFSTASTDICYETENHDTRCVR